MEFFIITLMPKWMAKHFLQLKGRLHQFFSSDDVICFPGYGGNNVDQTNPTDDVNWTEKFLWITSSGDFELEAERFFYYREGW